MRISCIYTCPRVECLLAICWNQLQNICSVEKILDNKGGGGRGLRAITFQVTKLSRELQSRSTTGREGGGTDEENIHNIRYS